MKNRDRNNLILGALVGAAIGYWLNSDQGRVTRTKAANVTSEGLKTAKNVAAEQLSTAKVAAEELALQGLEATQNALSSVQTKATEVSETIHQSFEKGISKAKNNVEEIEVEIATKGIADLA